jgi:hypothetical protein
MGDDTVGVGAVELTLDQPSPRRPLVGPRDVRRRSIEPEREPAV